jgi:hypothetical protein
MNHYLALCAIVPKGESVKVAHVLEGKELAILNRGGVLTIKSEKGEEIHLVARVDPLYERRVRQAAKARRAKGRKRKRALRKE